MRHVRTFAIAAVAFLGLLMSRYSGAQTVRCTTWNLEWFPNGSPKEAPVAQQDQRIKEAADVLRPIDPDIILLQEVRDYAFDNRVPTQSVPLRSCRLERLDLLARARGINCDQRLNRFGGNQRGSIAVS